jgi:hypothetical protein
MKPGYFTACLALSSLIGLSSFNNNTIKLLPVKVPKAQSVTAFLNSIGVNSSISRRGEQLDKTAEIINYTGIRWIRAGYEGDVPIADFLTLHQKTGVKYSYGLLSGGTDIPKLLEGGRTLAKSDALLAFEGNNEPNNWGINYKGVKGGARDSWRAVAELQRDLYAAVKAAASLKHYPVFSITENGAQIDNMGLQYLTIPQGADTGMPPGTRYADYANCHNYFSHPSWPGLHDNQTWDAASPEKTTHADGLYGNYGHTWGKQFAGYTEEQLATLPKVTTETGITIGDGVSEEAHARLLINMYLAQFKRGWSYTAVYLLRDRSDESGNQQFGFYKPDYTPRKAAVYLHNLTSILFDKKDADLSRGLAYTIADQPETVHDLLLKKSNGRYELIIWGERLQGEDNVQLILAAKPVSINIYDPTIGLTPVKKIANSKSVALTLTDHPLVVEIKP